MDTYVAFWFLILCVYRCYAIPSCDISSVNRYRCGDDENITRAECENLDCCYNPIATNNYPLKCYIKKEISRGMNTFSPTAIPRGRGQSNPLGPNYIGSEFLKFGGEPGYPGSMAVRGCDVTRVSNPIFRCHRFVRFSESTCLRVGCCWNSATSTCYRSSYFVTRIRNSCPPGFVDPPRCLDINECEVAPCMNEGVCIDQINSFRCECPPGIQGPTCNQVCGEPPAANDAQTTGAGATFFNAGDTVTYVCDPGFVLSLSTPSGLSMCLISGEWSLPNGVVCEKECMSPPSNSFTTHSPTRTTYRTGDTVSYSCMNGAIPIGSRTNLCLDTGLWQNEAPICSGCTDPNLISNGFYVDKDVYSENEDVQYNCNVDYLFARGVVETVTTCSAGSWSLDNRLPLCLKECTNLPTNVDLAVDLSPPYRFGETVTYTCSINSYQSGETTNTCTDSGWLYTSAQIAQCGIVCTDPPLHGALSVDLTGPYTDGVIVTYTCSFGIASVGADMNTCNSGTWSMPSVSGILQCDCPSPPDATSATYTTQVRYPLNEVVEYSCVAGFLFPATFVPASDATTTCLDDRTWSRDPATIICLQECTNAPPANALVDLAPNGPYREGDIVTYTCVPPSIPDTGFTTNRCQNGAWTEPDVANTLTCQTMCNPPPDVENGSYMPDKSDYDVADTITYECEIDYLLEPDTTMFMCQPDFSWNIVTAPQCKRECGDPQSIDHGVYTDVGNHPYPYREGAEVVYSCRGDAVLSDNSAIVNSVCTEDGLWTLESGGGVLPTCLKTCTDPLEITSGSISSVGTQLIPYRDGSQVMYSCNSNHVFLDPASETISTCQSDGSWSLEMAGLPTCVPANQNINLMIVFDATTSMDDCPTVETTYNFAAPFLPTAPFFNSVTLPNFFKQKELITNFINMYLRFTAGLSDLAVRFHSGGTCTAGAGENGNDYLVWPFGMPDNKALMQALLNMQGHPCKSHGLVSLLTDCVDMDFGLTTSAIPNVILLISTDVTTVTTFQVTLQVLDILRPNLPHIVTMSVLDTTDANYMTNEADLKKLACGSSNVASCTRFIGSIHEDISQILARFTAINFSP